MQPNRIAQDELEREHGSNQQNYFHVSEVQLPNYTYFDSYGC